MIAAGNQITQASLDALAALANQKIPNAMPFHFFPYGPHARVTGVRSQSIGPAIHVVADLAAMQQISNAAVGDYAIPRVAGGITNAYQATAVGIVATWTKLPFATAWVVNQSSYRSFLTGTIPPPTPFGTVLFDLQDYDFYSLPFGTGQLDQGGTADQLFGVLPFGWRTRFFYRWNPNIPGWSPVGSWMTELNRIRHFAFRALTDRNPATSEVDAGGLNVGIRESCRVSGPWPVLPGDPDNYLQTSFKEISSKQIQFPTLYFQSATAGLTSEPGSKGRIICYPEYVFEIVENIGQFPWFSGAGAGAGGPMMLMRLTVNTDQVGKLRGSVTFFDPVRPFANIGIQSTRIFNSQLSNLPNQRADETPGQVTQIYFDTDFAGGDLLLAADWQPISGAPFRNYMPTGLPVPVLDQKQRRPRPGTIDIGNANDHIHPYGSRGAALRFTIDYDVIPAAGISRNRLWKAFLSAEVKSNPSHALSGTVGPLRDDENIGAIGYGATLYPVTDPNFPDPAVPMGDGPGDPGLLPFPYVPNTNDNIYNGFIYAKTKPPLPLDFRVARASFAPATNHIWSQGSTILGIPPTPLKVNNEIAPYPFKRDNDPTPLEIHPVSADLRSFKGMITQITVSRMPDADGNFPADAPLFHFILGAFGILGHPDDSFTPLFEGALNDGQNFRTWRNDSDEFAGIPVLSPIPLIYRCNQLLIVQALFVPEVPLSNYSEALPVTFQSATDGADNANERLKYIGIPIMAHDYNDTESLLNLI